MSYDASRWAWEQPVKPAMRKLLLLAMADCVNAEAGEMVCWPSYAFLARRTGMNSKTVEYGVHELKNSGYIVDTGRRAGDTGKVVVYRLNAPETGAIKPGPQTPDANGTRPQNTPESGCISSVGNPPKTDANPPKNDGQSPQKVAPMTPKQGVRTSNGTRKEPRTEPGNVTAVAVIPGVPADLFNEWMVVRKDKRAKTLTQTAADGLLREATKAGLTPEEAVRLCVERNWISLNAGWVGVAAPSRPASKHAGFAGKNYREGVSDDGSFH